MGDRYVVLGFAPALRFLWSQIMCRLYKGPTDEIINLGPPPVCRHRQKDHIGTLKIMWSVSVFGRLWKHPTQHALKVSESSQC